LNNSVPFSAELGTPVNTRNVDLKANFIFDVDCFVAGIVPCDALKGVKSECSLNLADFCNHCLDRWAFLQYDLADDLPVRHLSITEIQVNDVADNFEAAWNLDSTGKHLLQYLLEAIIFVV